MSEGRAGAANSFGPLLPNGRASADLSYSHGQQQQPRTYSNPSLARGATSFDAFHLRRGEATEGRRRGQTPRTYNESGVRAPPHVGGGERRPFTATSNSVLASLIEEAPRTKAASYVTPHDAVQAQPAQHGATVVRSGSSATEGGSILFFSSVQKKGGAFTASERETYAQLHRSRAIPNVNRGRNAGNVTGSGVSAKSVSREYADLEKNREARALAQAETAVIRSKRSRFSLDDSTGEDDDEDEEDDSDAEAPAKRPATRST